MLVPPTLKYTEEVKKSLRNGSSTMSLRSKITKHRFKSTNKITSIVLLSPKFRDTNINFAVLVV
jgi:hypothetical protein